LDKYKIYLLKISLGLLFLINNSFAQNNQNTQFQDRNTTELVLFESVLPIKNYNLKNSDLLVKWHILLLDLIEQTDGYTPNVAARSLAYIDLAGYEAIVPAFPKLNSLSGQIQDYILPSIYKIDSNVFISQLAYNNAVFTVVNELFIAAPYIWMEKIVALKEEIDLEFSKGKSTYAIMKSKNYGISIGELILKYAEKDGGAKSLFRSYDLNYRLPKCESCFEINRVADLENTGPLHYYSPLNNQTRLRKNFCNYVNGKD
jgi:hypothetical protein